MTTPLSLKASKNVVKAIVKDLGFDIKKMEIEGKLKPINIKESDKQ